MNSKTKRKHTNGFNEDRLMLISWAAPVLAQLLLHSGNDNLAIPAATNGLR